VVSPPRTALALALSALFLAGCHPPPIQKAGGASGGEGGASGSPGGTGGKAADPDFTVKFPDGGAPDGAGDGAPGKGEESCAGELRESRLVPVDLLFLLDTSGSMEERAGDKSKWRSVRDAMESFIRDPQSAGLNVGLETFPDQLKPCQSDGACGGGGEYCGRKGACAPPGEVANVEPACYGPSPVCIDGAPCTPFGLCALTGLRCANMGQNCPGGLAGNTCVARPRFCTDLMRGVTCPATLYQTPMVPIGELPGARPALEEALATIVPEGGTPTTPAVQGALAHLRARATADSTRRQLLVLATDGMPSMCAPNTVDTAAAALAAARTANPSIPTYVIGVFSPAQLMRAQPALDQLATAGGTSTPFVLMTGADLTQRFIDAVNQIRVAAAGCEFTIPRPGTGAIDYEKVNVRVTTAAGNEDLVYVGSADRCDATRGGWYYDVDPKAGTPTRVLICEANCRKVKITVGLSVNLRYGCKTIVIQ